jgi:hypothetical protein
VENGNVLLHGRAYLLAMHGKGKKGRSREEKEAEVCAVLSRLFVY